MRESWHITRFSKHAFDACAMPLKHRTVDNRYPCLTSDSTANALSLFLIYKKLINLIYLRPHFDRHPDKYTFYLS